MRKHWDIQPSIFDCNGSSRVNEYGLEAVQGIDELGLFLFGEHRHSCFLIQ